jgi:D-alanyl-D-alanine carboxypeptidase
MKLIVLVWIFLSGLHHDYGQKPSLDNGLNRQKMDSFFSLLDQTNKMMGQITISRSGKILYQRSVGYVNVEKHEKTTDSSLYEIGSVTKTFTAIMILQLIEEKKLSLDTKLSVFFPMMPNARKIRIAQLLNHTSGLSDKFPIYLIKDAKSDEMTYSSHQKPSFVPGKKYIYCNENYGLLGLIIEKITNSTFEDQLQSRICKKIGLRNTWFTKRPSETSRLAFAYYKKAGKWQKEKSGDRSDAFSAGGIVSNTSDLNTFLYNISEGKLLLESSYNQLMNSLKSGYGYGIMPMQFYEKKGFGHSGDIGAFHSNVVKFPENELSISICLNGMDYSLNNILKGVLSIYYNMDFELSRLRLDK